MIVLLTGAPASGKTTVSGLLSKLGKFIIVPQDAFYNVSFTTKPEESQLKLEGCDIINWSRLLDVVVSCSKYTNVLVEGHCIMDNQELVKLADYCFFINMDKNTCKTRYMNRFSEQYTQKQLQKKDKYFESHVWVNHSNYFQKHKENEKIVLVNEDADCARFIMQTII